MTPGSLVELLADHAVYRFGHTWALRAGERHTVHCSYGDYVETIDAHGARWSVPRSLLAPVAEEVAR